MAALIEISTLDGEIFDLYNGVENQFYVTLQIHDLNSFETRNASFSKTIPLPPTPNNLSLLGIAGVGFSEPIQSLPVTLTLNGIAIAPNAKMLILNADYDGRNIDIEIAIMYGNFDFFDRIAGLQLDDINWADLALDWEVPNIIAASSNTEDLVWPLADWYTRNSSKVLDTITTNNIVDINPTGFFIYAKEIFNRVATSVGYEIRYGESVPEEFFQIALACPMTKFVEKRDEDAVATNLVVRNTVNQVVNGATERAAFQTRILDPGGRWNLTTYQWENIPTGNYSWQIVGEYSFIQGAASNDPSGFDLYRNTTLIATFELNEFNQGTDVPFFFATDLPIVTGDVVYLEIRATNKPGGGQDDTVTLNALSDFKVLSPGNEGDRSVQPSQYIPQMNASDFIRGILNVYNLVFTIDAISTVLTVESFNKIYEPKEPFVIDDFINTEKKIKVVPSIKSIARETDFKWQEDDLLRRDVNAEIKFESSALQTRTAAIDLPFSACDNSVQLFQGQDQFLKAKLPMVEKEVDYVGNDVEIQFYNTAEGLFNLVDRTTGDPVSLSFDLGDFLVYSQDNGGAEYQHRIIRADVERTSGGLQFPLIGITGTFYVRRISKLSINTFTERLAIVRRDGGEQFYSIQQGTPSGRQNLTGTSLTANWLDTLKWDNIVEGEYKQILDALRTPLVIQVWVSLTVAQLNDIEFLRPVYFAAINGYYYINKVEQYKVNNLCRLELVRINSLA